MSLVPWRSQLAQSLDLHRHQPQARYVQLATVRPCGRPANRTVVFRGFVEASHALRFVTDARSAKIEQIQQQPWGEVCWYFPETREQYRIAGRLKLIGVEAPEPEQTDRQVAWQQLSDAARSQFAWPTPGQRQTDAIAPLPTPSPDPQLPLDSFCLLLLQAEQVDYLDLRPTPHLRQLYDYDRTQGWSTQAINP